MQKIKSILPPVLIILLFVTRYLGINWGLPFPLHPDERNMAVAIVNLRCTDLTTCFHPNFFAYGQLPLYLAYILIFLWKTIMRQLSIPISFVEATLALRLISATASVLIFFLALKLIRLITGSPHRLSNYLLLIFSPVLIQLAHFGTTESLLMLFYLLLIFFSWQRRRYLINQNQFLWRAAVVSGLAVATKISSLIFLVLPVLTLFWIVILQNQRNKQYLSLFFQLGLFGSYVLLIALIFSPYNFIDFSSFLTAFKYEVEVALGKIPVFYTQQFSASLPVIFQLVKIFPYALGGVSFVFFILGMIFLPWRGDYLLLRLAFFSYFLPTVGSWVKWTRFMAPIYPLMLIIAVLFFNNLQLVRQRILKNKHRMSLLFYIFEFLFIGFWIIPGAAYLNIYLQEDSRVKATRWINQNIPENAFLLQEAANVVNLPLVSEKRFQNEVFDFYNLDNDHNLQLQLAANLQQADYIIVPSRRIFANYTCETEQNKVNNLGYASFRCRQLAKRYPQLTDYYHALFSGQLGFVKIAEFSSFYFSDEQAEETWSVFDHPVIRIYKKISD